MTTGDSAPVLDEGTRDRSIDEAGGAPTGALRIGGGSVLDRLGLTGWDGAIVAITCMAVLLFLPSLMFSAWTPRAVLLLGAAPVGLLALAFDRGRVVVLAWAVIGWSVLSALLSSAPRSALVGFAGRDLSTLTVVAAFGFWALGRRASVRGRAVLADVFIWAMAIGALIGLLQVVLQLETGSLALRNGRATGFLNNAVYFGAMCAAGLGAATARLSKAGSPWILAAIALLGIGTSLSGSRVALLAVVATCVALLATQRTRRAAVSVVAAAAALGLGVLIDRFMGVGRNAADRLAENTGGGRITAWSYGLDAWTDRPVVGYGLGMFRPAVQDRFSLEFVRDHARDEVSQAWFDPHNVVVGMLVSVGVVGLVLMSIWFGLAVRRANGPLVWALIPIGLHWMLQPVSLFTLPLAMLFLGAAAPSERTAALGRRWLAPLVAVGVLLGGYLLVADVRLRLAVDAEDPVAAESAAAMFGADPIARDVVAQLYEFDVDRSDRDDQVIEWRRKTAEAEPDRPFWWSLLGIRLIDVGRPDEAEAAIDTARELQEYNSRTWTAYGRLAIERDDADGLQEALDLLCELGQEDCGLDAELLLEARNETSRPEAP